MKGFLTWISDKGYEEARKLLAQWFGNPFRVAKAYKAKLQNWPQIVEGDSSSLQDFSDFLVCREGAMQSFKYIDELNSSRLLQEISTKLSLKSGSRWYRQARDVLRKTERTVSFHYLVEFVREEADKETKRQRKVQELTVLHRFPLVPRKPRAEEGLMQSKGRNSSQVCAPSVAVTTNMTSVQNCTGKALISTSNWLDRKASVLEV